MPCWNAWACCTCNPTAWPNNTRRSCRSTPWFFDAGGKPDRTLLPPASRVFPAPVRPWLARAGSPLDARAAIKSHEANRHPEYPVMKRLIILPLLLPLAGAAFAASPPSPSSAGEPAAAMAATQRELATLQTRMNELAQRMAELSARLGDEANASALRYLADSRRGMLGLAADTAAGGWRVVAVTPGGPAERAGVRAGDLITAVDGKPADRGGGAIFGDDLMAGKPVTLSAPRCRDRRTPSRRRAPHGKRRGRRCAPRGIRSRKWNRPGSENRSSATSTLRSGNPPGCARTSRQASATARGSSSRRGGA